MDYPTRTTEGLKFTTLLSPELGIGDQVGVRYFDPMTERVALLNVVVSEVAHRGGTHTVDFNTSAKARVVGQVGQ